MQENQSVKKKRSTKEIIESTPYPKIEHVFIKYQGREVVEITDYERSNRIHAVRDPIYGKYGCTWKSIFTF